MAEGIEPIAGNSAPPITTQGIEPSSGAAPAVPPTQGVAPVSAGMPPAAAATQGIEPASAGVPTAPTFPISPAVVPPIAKDTPAVRYDMPQALSDAQKAQAQSNIGVAEKLATLGVELAAAESDRATLTATLSANQAELDAAKVDLAALLASDAVEKAELDAAQADIAALAATLSANQTALDAAEVNIVTLNHSVAAIQARDWVRVADNTHSSSVLVGGYPSAVISLMIVSEGINLGYPSQFGVIVTDHRGTVGTNANYAHQEFREVTKSSNNIYYRKSLISGWTDWREPLAVDSNGHLSRGFTVDEDIEVLHNPDPNVNDDVVLPVRMTDIRYAKGNTFEYGSTLSTTARKLEIQFPSSFTETGFVRLGVDVGFWSITHYAEIVIYKGGTTNTHNIDVVSSQYSSRSQPMIGASIDNTGINVTLTIQINSAINRPFFMMVKPLQQSPLGINRFREATYTVSEADAEYLAGTGAII